MGVPVTVRTPGRVSPALIAATITLVLACSEPDQPASVSITPHTVRLTALGATHSFAVAVLDKESKAITGANLAWASSDASVVRVDPNGVATAVGGGSATVTASVGSLLDSAKVIVVQVPTKAEASGTSQSGTVGQPLPQALTVSLRDSLDNPVAHAAFSFAVIDWTYKVTDTGGAVSPSSGTTDSDGRVSALWTLGTRAGRFLASFSATGFRQTLYFYATATPGPASALVQVAGDSQFGYQQTSLAQLIAVQVLDAYGNAIASHPVQFSVAPGNGTVGSAAVVTGAEGVAQTSWTMPPIAGTGLAADTITLQAAAADASGAPLAGSPRAFTAVAHNLSVTVVSPSPMNEGQAATLSGSGFDPANTRDVVTIDSLPATVTSASETQLTVTVPTYDCMPRRPVNVQVTVAGIRAAPVTETLVPSQAPLDLVEGQQIILSDPAAFCFQLNAGPYLIGVMSTSETPSELTPVKVTAIIAPAPLAPSPDLRLPTGVQKAAPVPAARLQRWLDLGRAEVQRRSLDRELYQQAARGPRASAAGAPARAVSQRASVGDSVTLNFPGSSCSPGHTIRTVVRANGSYGVFLEDVKNPVLYNSTQFAAFQELYDAKVYATDTLEFGTPADADGNGRVVIVITQEVNKLGGVVAGFATGCDLLAPDSTNASNGGEFIYLLSPDPTGSVTSGIRYPISAATRDMPQILAHESVHVIQLGRRLARAAPFPDVWLAEGQAVLGQELVGDTLRHYLPRTNRLGLAQALSYADTTLTDFYGLPFLALALYFGLDPLSSPAAHVAQAPWECTWLDVLPLGTEPCVNALSPYGVPWLLLRYLSDRFDGRYPGGEAGIQRALIDNPLNGYALLQAVTGMPVDSLLVQFAGMLYADDYARVVPAELEEATWKLGDVFYGTYTVGNVTYSMAPQARLTPTGMSGDHATSYGWVYTQDAKVRAGSSLYLLFPPAYPMSLKARTLTGDVLPAHMRFWIFVI